MVAYALLSIVFLFFYIKYKESVLPLHTAFVFVFLIALVESTLWYASYQEINLTGEPNCCPFPPLVIGSLVSQVCLMFTTGKVFVSTRSLPYFPLIAINIFHSIPNEPFLAGSETNPRSCSTTCSVSWLRHRTTQVDASRMVCCRHCEWFGHL